MVWSTTITLEYYWFGGAITGAATWVQIVLIAAGVIGTVITLRLLGRHLGEAGGALPDHAVEPHQGQVTEGRGQ